MKGAITLYSLFCLIYQPIIVKRTMHSTAFELLTKGLTFDLSKLDGLATILRHFIVLLVLHPCLSFGEAVGPDDL